MDGWIVGERIDGWIYGWRERWMDVGRDESTDGWMDIQTESQTDLSRSV